MEGQDYNNTKHVIQILNKVTNPKLVMCNFIREYAENFQDTACIHTNLELVQGKF